MFIKVFVIASFCITASLQSTPFNTCKSGPPPTELQIAGCNATPCILPRGKIAKAQWNFNAVANARDLKPVVIAKVLGITWNYPMPDENACNYLISSKCPLHSGEAATFSLSFPIHKALPLVSVHLTFSLVDENDQIHSCFEIDAKVVH